jgi:hypothetical protein
LEGTEVLTDEMHSDEQFEAIFDEGGPWVVSGGLMPQEAALNLRAAFEFALNLRAALRIAYRYWAEHGVVPTISRASEGGPKISSEQIRRLWKKLGFKVV